jgi:hypothetical protein
MTYQSLWDTAKAVLRWKLIATSAYTKKIIESRALVAHAYYPSHSGGRDQEDGGLKPAQANSLPDLILKKPFTKKDWEVAQGVEPGFKPQFCKKKKKKKSWKPGMVVHVYNPST